MNDTQKAVADYLEAEKIAFSESLMLFCDLFGVKVKDWSHSYIKTDAENSHFRGWNKAKVNAIPEFLTGYCLDCAFIEEFKKEFEKTGDALYSFNEAIDAGLKEWVNYLEDQESDEYVSEHLIANDYQFLENGRMI